MAGLFKRLFGGKAEETEEHRPPEQKPKRIIPRRVPEILASVPLAEIDLAPRSDYPNTCWLDLKLRTATFSPPIVPDEYGNFIAVDVETTGLDPVPGEVLEVAALRFEHFRPVELFTALTKPLHFPTVPVAASEVNGITNEDLAEAITFVELLPSLQDFIDNSKIIVGHNLPFDVQFLFKSGVIFVQERLYVDTLENAKKYLKGRKYDRSKGYNLAALCDHYGIELTDAHCAAADCLAAGELYRSLLCDMADNG